MENWTANLLPLYYGDSSVLLTEGQDTKHVLQNGIFSCIDPPASFKGFISYCE